jgi:hypothetical protein
MRSTLPDEADETDEADAAADQPHTEDEAPATAAAKAEPASNPVETEDAPDTPAAATPARAD